MTAALTQKQILELALSGAIDVWADFRFLAGLEGATDAGFNYRCSAKESEMEKARQQMEIWSAKCDWISAEIKKIEAEERAQRKRTKIKEVPAA